MQDEINEKTIALYIKTGKLTAQTLQKAMKTLLAQMKKQKDKTPQGKQTLCVIDSLCLLVGGDVLHQHRHIRKPFFNAL